MNDKIILVEDIMDWSKGKTLAEHFNASPQQDIILAQDLSAPEPIPYNVPPLIGVTITQTGKQARRERRKMERKNKKTK